MGLDKLCSGKCLILCSCEGRNEEDAIDWLLDEDKLIFTRNDLIDKKCTRDRQAKKIQDRYLSYDHEKEVVVLRIIDRVGDKFKLGKLFVDRFDVLNIITNPEIEILMILHRGDYQEYIKKGSKMKPSLYAKSNYSEMNIKTKGSVKDFFGDINSLIGALEEHKKRYGKDHLTLYDLVKK